MSRPVLPATTYEAGAGDCIDPQGIAPSRPPGRRRLLCAAIALVLAATFASRPRGDEPTKPVPRPSLPPQLAPNERFASSSACQECHAEQYQSWHRTYHRTMTQTASPENFVGQFDGTSIDSRGLSYRVFKRGDQFWAEMPDPDEMLDRQRTYEMKTKRGIAAPPPEWSDIPRVERQVVMSTGSHRYQTYWVQSQRYPGTLMTLPLVFLIQDKRWIPREAAFVSPPDSHRMITVWNDHCINCHSTGGAPLPYATNDPITNRVLETGFQTHVGELGIACEACHGPAEEHARLRTEAAAAGGAGEPPRQWDDPIVQPEHLTDHRRSTEVCGQCHGVFVRTPEQAARYRDGGGDFVPGEPLHDKRNYIFPPQDREFYPDEGAHARALQNYRNNQEFFHQRFWDNGLVLAGGREYSALAVTKCYLQGELSCLSCHSMHQSDPDDQLKPGMDTSAACTGCHLEERYTTAVTEHTHHAADSTGSNCLNCHMPHTAYALFSATRNHQIESPDLAGSVEHGVPIACNLCHLDKSLGWTQEHLADWYGYEKHELTVQQSSISAVLVWMLQGDAAQRVIAAWHVGWAPARAASGDDWMAPFAARLLADPYGVVRYVAHRSLKSLPGFGELEYNFLAAPAELDGAVAAAIQQWRRQRLAAPSRTGREVLIGADGEVSEAAVRWLLDHRDNRPVTIQE